MGKGLYLIGAIIVVILIIIGGGYLYLAKSPTRTAFLNIESPAVQVDTGKGWQPATDGMDLGLDDKVKTSDSGEASIVLYETAIVALEPNTEVAIADLSTEKVNIEQNSGATWNKFTGITGIVEFSITTPTTVATVRGTEFGVDMKGIVVAEGVVEVTADGETFRVTKSKKIVLRDGQWVEEDLTPEDRQRIIKNMRRTLGNLKQLRQDEINKKKLVYEQLKKQYDMTDADVQNYLDRADRGEFDLDEVEQKAPEQIRNLESAQKIKAMTREIINQNRAIEELIR